MIRGIIFDMDGVIINSEVAYLENVRDFLKQFDFHVTFNQLMYAIGRSDKQICEYFYSLTKHLHSFKPSDLMTLFYAYEKTKLQPYSQILIPEIKPLLKSLEPFNLKFALASSSPRSKINKVINECDLSDVFDFVISGEELNESKPNPEIFLKSVSGLSLTPDTCLIIEDSYNGVLAANRAKVSVVGYKHIEYTADLSSADFVVDNLLDIVNIIKKV